MLETAVEKVLDAGFRTPDIQQVGALGVWMGVWVWMCVWRVCDAGGWWEVQDCGWVRRGLCLCFMVPLLILIGSPHTHPYYLQEGMTLVGCKRMGEEVKKALAAL